MKKRHPHKQKILLVNITRLGDMLQATPTIAGMKAENPECHITVLVEKQFESVCHIIPNIDEIVAIDLTYVVRCLAREREGVIEAYEYLHKFVEDLNTRGFDYSLNMSSSAYTALLLNLLGIKNRGGWTADEEGYRIIESDWAKLFATSVFHQNRQLNSLNLVDVFRCSADVDQHPRNLLINVEPEARVFAEELLKEAKFTNSGPLILLQAGASQAKRQWMPERFVRLIEILLERLHARVVMVGTKKELSIIDPIKAHFPSENVYVAAGKTSIPQLVALLEMGDILITGDTGPMHISVAVDTPVVSMFLASAYGFETGPYREGSLVIQPVIGCGPCNPNKACAKTECHDTITPELVAQLTELRLAGDVRTLPAGMADPRQVWVYRTRFDEYGFCDMEPLNDNSGDPYRDYRTAYRQVWLDDLGGLDTKAARPAQAPRGLKIAKQPLEGLEAMRRHAKSGRTLIETLIRLVRDTSAPATELGRVNTEIVELDRQIEETGYHFAPLGPLSRMFIFAKENIQGTDPVGLAEQMSRIYQDLERRCDKFEHYYNKLG